jgi:hypothetical protein
MSSSGILKLCGFIINRRFGGTCRLHLQGRRHTGEGKCKTIAYRLTTVLRALDENLGRGEVRCVSNRLTPFIAGGISSTLKTEAIRYPETSFYNNATWRHIPEDGILHSSLPSENEIVDKVQTPSNAECKTPPLSHRLQNRHPSIPLWKV